MTDAVAWYGAVVATSSLYLGIYLALRDRSRPKISARANQKLGGNPGAYDPSKTYIVATITNKGRRVFIVSKVWLQQRGDSQGGLIFVDSMMVKGGTRVEEGESKSFLMAQENLDLEAILGVAFQDQIGRKWKGTFTR